MAAKTITQRIAITGGQEIEVQLKNIGDAGATSLKRVNDGMNQVAATAPKVSASFAAIGKSLEEVGKSASKFASSVSDAGAAAETFGRRLLTIATAAVGVGVGFGALVVRAGEAAEAIKNGAEAAQLSVGRYQDLQAAFRISGVGADALDTAVARLNKSFGTSQNNALQLQKSQLNLSEEFAAGKISSDQFSESMLKLQKDASTNIDAFTKLGVTFTSVGGDTDKALKEVALRILDMPRGIARASLEMEIFGRSGSRLDPVLKDLAGIGDAAQGLVRKLSPLEVEVGAKLAAAFRTLQENVDRTYNHFYLTFGPAVARLITEFSKALLGAQGYINALADNISQRLEPVIRDLIAFLRDGKDATTPGGLIDSILTGLTNLGAAIEFLVKSAVIGFKFISAALQPLADLINKVFGTETSGQIILIIGLILQFTGGIKLLTTTVTALFEAFSLVKSVMLLAFTPGGPLLIGIGLLIAGLTIIAVENWPAIKEAASAALTVVEDGIKSVVDWLKSWDDWLGSIIEKFKAAIGLQSQANSDSSNQATSGFAGGGHVRGPGSGTSDSILARLSNGEFVQRAAAVAYYGPAFMSALNNLRIPRGILDGLAGFANGGLVRAVSNGMHIPAFATGGMVSTDGISGGQAAGHPLTLVIDGEKFTGMTAEDRTFDKLSRFAVRRTIQSAGRKALWTT